MGVSLAVAPAARADHVAVLLTSSFEPSKFAGEGAVGLLVPGRGPTVTRRETLDLLDLDRVRQGECLNRRPCPIEIFVALPPVEERHNVERYSIAIVGGGYEGLLVSKNTKIPGLVAPGDLVPTIEALETGKQPPLGWRPDDDPGRTLRDLDRRLTEAHDARNWANAVLVASIVALAGVALLRRSTLLARAALLAAPAALLGALLLSALDLPSAVLLAGLVVAGALAGALLPLTPVLAAFLVAYGVVLYRWPEVNSLAIIGPHPDGGGRFYGITNQVATLLLVPALLAGAALSFRWLLGVALFTVGITGASAAGADGGGAVVLTAAFVVLALRLGGVELTRRRLALVAAGGVVAGLGVAALDAVLGGSSHVTRALGEGPVGLAEELGHRVEVSFEGATSSWHALLLVVAGIAALAWLATRKGRPPVLDAALAGLALSFVVNDTPTDVAAFGALSCGALYVWSRLDAVK